MTNGNAAASAANDESCDPIGQEARAALSKAGGDVSKAGKLLIERVRRDRALKSALLEPLLEYACHQAVAAALRQHRGTVWQQPAIRSGLTDEQRVAALAADNLLMFPLPGGKPLGDAARSEVAEAADFYGKQATDMAHKSRWLCLIAQSIPDGKSVKDIMTSERLRELQSGVRRG